MKTLKERKQEVANALKGAKVHDALSILREVKASIKYNARVRFEKNHFTKESQNIKVRYQPHFAVGMLESMVRDCYIKDEENGKKEEKKND